MQIELSDVISFTTTMREEFEKRVRWCRLTIGDSVHGVHGAPNQSTFQGSCRWPRSLGGAYNWGWLTEKHRQPAWDSWQKPYTTRAGHVVPRHLTFDGNPTGPRR